MLIHDQSSFYSWSCQYCKSKIKDASPPSGGRHPEITSFQSDYWQHSPHPKNLWARLSNCKEKPSMSCSLVIFCSFCSEELSVCTCRDPAKILFFFLVLLSVGVLNLICFHFSDNGVLFYCNSTRSKSWGYILYMIGKLKVWNFVLHFTQNQDNWLNAAPSHFGWDLASVASKSVKLYIRSLVWWRHRLFLVWLF